MIDEYFKRMIYASVAESHRLSVELAIAASLDPSIEKQLDKVITSLRRSNNLITKLTKNKKITLRRQVAGTDQGSSPLPGCTNLTKSSSLIDMPPLWAL
jgi:hypothetical protein